MHRDYSYRWFWLLLLIAALSVLLPRSGNAKSLWHLRAHAVWLEPDLDYRVPTSEDEPDITATAAGSFGLGISAEYQFSDRLGLELGILRTTPKITLDYSFGDLGLQLQTSDNLAMTPISLGLDIHLLPKERLDVYIAPVVAYVWNSDLEFIIDQTFEIGGQTLRIRDEARVTVASEFAYGATLGVDIPFSARPWAVATSLRYLATELDARDPEGDRISPDFNSWILTAGLRYSF